LIGISASGECAVSIFRVGTFLQNVGAYMESCVASHTGRQIKKETNKEGRKEGKKERKKEKFASIITIRRSVIYLISDKMCVSPLFRQATLWNKYRKAVSWPDLYVLCK
jgi:hypothetical protein